MKRILSLLILALVIAFGFTGCTLLEKNRLPVTCQRCGTLYQQNGVSIEVGEDGQRANVSRRYCRTCRQTDTYSTPQK